MFTDDVTDEWKCVNVTSHPLHLAGYKHKWKQGADLVISWLTAAQLDTKPGIMAPARKWLCQQGAKYVLNKAARVH